VRSSFTAFSAGSHPSGVVSTEALAQINAAGLRTDGLRNKLWDEFAAPGAPPLDFVFTVCDNAAQEVCPHWPGQPITAHWGAPDPVTMTGSEEVVDRAYKQAFAMLQRRISPMLSLPLGSLDSMFSKRNSTILEGSKDRQEASHYRWH
jgi:arsenate reductase